MRVAVLLTGQMRRYTDPDVIQSLTAYFAMFSKTDVFISTWSNRGVSYNHGQVQTRGDEADEITEDFLRRLYPNMVQCAIHDFAAWEAALEGCRKQVYTEGFQWNGGHIRGTVVPQFFGLWDANRMRIAHERETGAYYDVVIRVRPDVIFAPHLRSLYRSLVANTIYAINNKRSGTYYPQRIYDIFFFGTPDAMNRLCQAYENFEILVTHPWQNGLHPRDACRCLYVQARFLNGMTVVDLPQDVCCVKR